MKVYEQNELDAELGQSRSMAPTSRRVRLPKGFAVEHHEALQVVEAAGQVGPILRRSERLRMRRQRQRIRVAVRMLPLNVQAR